MERDNTKEAHCNINYSKTIATYKKRAPGTQRNMPQ